MASKIEVILIDDLDGTDASETVKFGLGDQKYEIDLTSGHAQELRAIVKQYIPYARAMNPAKTKAAKKAKVVNRQLTLPSSVELRAWAKENKIKVSDRGKVSAEVLAQWRSAHKHYSSS